MKYLLLAYVDQTAKEPSPEEDAAMERHVVSWVQEMTDRGVRLFGSRRLSVAQRARRRGGGRLLRRCR